PAGPAGEPAPGRPRARRPRPRPRRLRRPRPPPGGGLRPPPTHQRGRPLRYGNRPPATTAGHGRGPLAQPRRGGWRADHGGRVTRPDRRRRGRHRLPRPPVAGAAGRTGGAPPRPAPRGAPRP